MFVVEGIYNGNDGKSIMKVQTMLRGSMRGICFEHHVIRLKQQQMCSCLINPS